jgi:predicted O-linked N-acetylglucosamine transferase (SPINDLY family)
VESYRRALQIDPGFADAHRDLGNVYSDLGQHELAAASFRRAIEIQTDCSELYSNLGNALKELGQYDAAVASYGRALELNPAYSGAHNNLGNALKELGQIDAAISSYRQALQTDPGFAEAHCNLGVALSDLRRFDDAVACYCKALELKPDHAWAHCNLGNARKDLGQLDQALACYRRALQIKPDFADAHSNLLFTLNYRSDQSAAALLSEARRYGDSVARRARASESWSNPADPARRLRVGLVSGDLRDHPVAYFIEGVLAALASTASERIELYAYSNHFHEDAFSAKIKQSCRNWLRAKALSDEQLAQRIRNDGIDILIDLSGHTAHNRLPMFAWKPAPVQLSWLGYFATTGVAAIDYFLADPWTLPHAEECNFTEKIWRFPQSRLCFTPPAELIEAGPLPALLNCHISFACFNDLAKINDSVIAVWARVLAAVPNSRLLLKARQLADPVARQDMLDRFARHGIAAARLLLEGPSSRIDYLQTYRQVDIVLDTFPFPGGTTTAEALWMGVPVLTLAGGGFLSRQGVGLLMNAGLPEWVASDVEDFVARALTHASDLPALAALRGRLRQQVLCSPVFDAAGFAQHFESALRDIWVGWCDEQAAKP